MRFFKYFFVLFFCFFLIFTFEPVVKAESLTEDNSAYDFCFNEGYDSLKNAYKFRYRCYNKGGCWEGTFYIPSDIYSSTDKSYCVVMSNNGTLCLFQANSLVDFSIHWVEYRGMWVFALYGQDTWRGKEYHYNNDTNTFDFHYECSSDTYVNFGPNYISPDSVLSCNTDFKFHGKSYISRRSNDVLTVPTFRTLESKGFRLYLRDFHGYTETGSAFDLDRVLEGLYMNLYDYQQQAYIMTKIDVLSYRDVEQDSEGNYYIDILYDNLPRFSSDS